MSSVITSATCILHVGFMLFLLTIGGGKTLRNIAMRQHEIMFVYIPQGAFNIATAQHMKNVGCRKGSAKEKSDAVCGGQWGGQALVSVLATGAVTFYLKYHLNTGKKMLKNLQSVMI